jgi:hypothetical protein
MYFDAKSLSRYNARPISGPPEVYARTFQSTRDFRFNPSLWGQLRYFNSFGFFDHTGSGLFSSFVVRLFGDKGGYLHQDRRRRTPNAKSPAASVNKVAGSGVTVVCTVVFPKSKPAEFTTTPRSEVNGPGNNVGAEVIPVYIWGPKTNPNASVQFWAFVPLKQIANPPPFPPLKNRIKVGVIATGEPFRE